MVQPVDVSQVKGNPNKYFSEGTENKKYFSESCRDPLNHVLEAIVYHSEELPQGIRDHLQRQLQEAVPHYQTKVPPFCYTSEEFEI